MKYGKFHTRVWTKRVGFVINSFCGRRVDEWSLGLRPNLEKQNAIIEIIENRIYGTSDELFNIFIRIKRTLIIYFLVS